MASRREVIESLIAKGMDRAEAEARLVDYECEIPEAYRIDSRGRRRLVDWAKQKLRADGYNIGGRPRGEQVHGTLNSYRLYECRCPECVEASREHVRKYRARKKAKAREESRHWRELV
jgi:hypothetical protein